MRDQASLRRAIVIGRDDQRGGGARILGGLHQTHGFSRVVGPGACNDRNAASGVIDDSFDDQIVFCMSKCRAFACCADRNQPVCALIDMPVDKAFQGGKVDLSVCERCDECDVRAFEH
jgi:hypothetical protein